MQNQIRKQKRDWLQYLLAFAIGALFLQLCVSNVGGDEEHTSLQSLCNADYPDTFISQIHLDLSSPNHWVRLSWSGPQAASQDSGPFRSCPGAGWGTNDCNDPVESNCPNSFCTPKGTRKVEGLMDHLKDIAEFRYATVIDKHRAIAFHSHSTIPPYPASAGCVRLEPYVARLIHDNSIVGKTEILIDGTWTNPKSRGQGTGDRGQGTGVREREVGDER